MADTRPRCGGTNKQGGPCQGAALPGSTLCWFHDPARAEERRRACHNGGKSRMRAAAVLPADAPEPALRSPQDVQALLSRTIYDVAKGRLDTKVANAIAYLASTWLQSWDRGEADDRITELEKVVHQREASRP